MAQRRDWRARLRYLVENLALDALASAGIHSFCLNMVPVKFTGATGSPVRPVAIV